MQKYWLILAVIEVIALLSGFVFLKNARLVRIPTKAFYTSLILVVAGFVYFYFASTAFEQKLQTKYWPIVTGQITESTVEGERAFHPLIKYRYTVNSVEYTGVTSLGMPMFGGRNSRRTTATKMSEENPAGKEVPVYYAPNNHKNSRLKVGPEFADYGSLGVSYTLCLLFSTIISGYLFGNRKTG